MTPSKCILVAEDNPDDVFMLKRAFTKAKLNATVQFVDNGEAAIAYLRGNGEFADRSQHPIPNLVLLDIKMPVVTGFGVLEWMQQQPAIAHLPVAILTSSAESRDVDRAYDLGANSYLVKPNDIDDLLDLISTLQKYWLQLNHAPERLNEARG